MARLQSMVSMVFMIVPMAAPSMGQAVLAFANWRWIFGVMALLSAAVALWAALRLPKRCARISPPDPARDDRAHHGPGAPQARRWAMCSAWR
jgi:MFS family permease